ncbi:MAG TPA: hypothetical protein VL651_02320 [Bacteroidia bacterium]|nr:hypothetical protein [Bacteroidia bacterium]
MRNHFLTIIAVCFAGILSAQDSTHHCFLKPWSVEVRSGVSIYADVPLANYEMQMLAPSSEFLKRDFSGYGQNHPFPGFLIDANSEFGMNVQFQPYSKRSGKFLTYSVIRAGFNYSSVQLTGPHYSKYSSVRYDTVTSGNLTLYMDSIHSDSYNFDWNTNIVSLNFSQVFHTNDAKIFSAGIGYGMMVGAGINSRFSASRFIMDMIQATSYGTTVGGVYNVSENYSSEYETIRTGTSFFARIYFPVQMQLRLSRKDNFFNHLALTGEFSPGLDMISIPNLGLRSHPVVTNNFGLKYYFEKSPTKWKIPSGVDF